MGEVTMTVFVLPEDASISMDEYFTATMASLIFFRELPTFSTRALGLSNAPCPTLRLLGKLCSHGHLPPPGSSRPDFICCKILCQDRVAAAASHRGECSKLPILVVRARENIFSAHCFCGIMMSSTLSAGNRNTKQGLGR
jgi:hypothetical protein